MSRTAILITHQLDVAKPHLKRCLDAVLNSKLDNDDIVCVASGAETPIIRLPGYERIHFIENRALDTSCKKTAAQVAWIAQNHREIETIVLMSDDIVVSDVCLKQVSMASKSLGGIVAPLTNSEIGCNVLTSVRLPSEDGKSVLDLRPNHSIEEADPYLKAVRLSVGPDIIIREPWVSFAIVAMPLKLYADLGGTDPQLEYRHNDEMFCYQAKQLGAYSFIYLGAFALHYGSVTLDAIPQINEYREQCSKNFAAKINGIMTSATT